MSNESDLFGDFDDMDEPTIPVKEEEAGIMDRLLEKVPGFDQNDREDPFQEELCKELPGADDPLYEKIASQQTRMGDLMAKIPGIGSYMEKNRRREADQLLRKTIVGRLEETRVQLSGVHQALSADIIMAIDHAEPLGRADTRLMGLIGKINDAPTGYAGFFDAIKIKEDELSAIYKFDEQMFDHAEQISADVTALQTTISENGGTAAAIQTLDAAIQNALLAFNGRKELLSGFA